MFITGFAYLGFIFNYLVYTIPIVQKESMVIMSRTIYKIQTWEMFLMTG